MAVKDRKKETHATTETYETKCRINIDKVWPAMERRHVKLHKSGGSLSVIIPKEWLALQQIGDVADIVLSQHGIIISKCVDQQSIEDEPEFANFLNFILADMLSRPERNLVDTTDLFNMADDLTAGVDED